MSTVAQQNAFWVKANGCKAEISKREGKHGVVETSWESCKDGSVVRAIFAGHLEHNWPSTKRGGFDGSKAVFEFFLSR